MVILSVFLAAKQAPEPPRGGFDIFARGIYPVRIPVLFVFLGILVGIFSVSGCDTWGQLTPFPALLSLFFAPRPPGPTYGTPFSSLKFRVRHYIVRRPGSWSHWWGTRWNFRFTENLRKNKLEKLSIFFDRMRWVLKLTFQLRFKENARKHKLVLLRV